MLTKILDHSYRPLLFLTIICALLASGLPVTPANSQSSTYVDVAGGAYEQIEVTLQADSAPAPGGIVNFTFAATPLRDAPDLTITWELPDGGILLGGAASEPLGMVAVGQTVQQVRQMQFAQEGIFEVRAAASYHPDAATTLTAHGVLFFTVRSDGSTVSDGNPRAPRYTPPPAKPTIDKSATVVAANAWGPDVPQGCFTVTGVLTREERQPAANPPRYVDQLGSARPVHHILVEMREEDTFSDDSYGHTVTDDNGRFEFRFCDDDGFLNDELELYYRVCSEVWDGPRIARIEQTSEQELYCWDSGTKDSEGGTVDFDLAVYRLNQIESQIFNIADTLYYARKFWNDNTGGASPVFDRSVRVFWEAGKKQTGSFYNDDRSILVIADDASSFDQWDDSVIIHEWGHFADHQFSCNQNPGGAHTLPGNNIGPTGRQLSWGEGYPDYYQSAARTIMPGSGFTSFYIDVNGPTVDLETLPGTATDRNEGAIAALLWDFLDATNDGSDTVSHGQARIQQVYAAAGFQGNTQCDMRRFLKVWKDLSLPTDAQTAATVVQNTGINNPFAAVTASTTEPLLTAASAQASNADPLDYRWWDQVTMVVDNSTSMAGGAPTTKLDAVKAVIGEQVNDYTRNPLGTEFNLYTFNASSPLNNTLLEGRFFAEGILPAVNGLVANGGDAGCYVNALNAMTQAVQTKYNGHAWLYTDGETTENTNVEFLRQLLNQRRVHGSFVLLQGCNSLPTKQSDVTGAEKNYLGLAANGSQPGSIVPYLLTAIGSGGQFLFVAPNQLANAVDILRAQLSHSAGAGRWSDYVSDFPTYRWDKLTSWEYRWIDTSPGAGGVFAGQPYNKAIRVNLPQSVPIYGNPATHGWVQDDGYILMGDALDAPTLDVLYAPLQWQFRFCGPNVVAASPTEVPCNTDRVEIYTKQEANWFAITTEGIAAAGNPRAYQALLDAATGELRYQYRNVEGGDIGNAEIAVTDIANNRRTLVSNKDINGASNGMGYKFTPAPPQPTKNYTVEVDALMQGVGFLTTGYSGSLDPMLVQYPDGTAVDCNDTANVICLNLNNGLVQYVQVNVNGRTGIYTAAISAGATGEGTFSFNALAASTIRPASRDKRLVALNAHVFHLDLGRTADGNVLQGWLQRPNGAHFGAAFTLYDDGAHDDDAAGDGLFGSDAFTPPAASVAYLWVRGTLDGVEITRSDPTPFNFQPIDVQPEQEYVQGFLGSPAPVVFLVTNQDSVRHCYRMEVSVPAGWNLASLPDPTPCVEAGATNGPYAFVDHPLDNQSGGVTGEVSATFTEVEEGRISGGASATVAFFRPLKAVEFDNRWTYTYLRPNSTDTVSMTINLLDDQGQISGWSGALGYVLNTTLGTVTAPTDGRFENGRLPIVFTTGAQTGDALINFVLEGDATTTTTLQIRDPVATQLDLVATPTDLRGGVNSSALVVTLRDAGGDPVVGQTVRLSVSDDDGNQGTINGGEVFTATTDANGQVSVTFTKSSAAAGTVAVRAEALRPDAAGLRVTHEALAILTLSDAPPAASNPVYLPLIHGADQTQASSLLVFDEALAAGWEDWSWDSTVDLAQSSLAHSGSQAIAVTYNVASAGLSLRAPDPISTSGYTALQFWVYGSGGGNALLAYTEASDEGPVSPAQHAFTALPNVWTQVTVPLSALGNPALIKRITIQENGGAPQATFYVDEVRLVGNRKIVEVKV